MTIHFAVLHAVHRQEHTLLQCIASLHAAGAEHVTVFPDNGSIGAIKNWHRAMQYLLECANHDHHVCVLDEDFILDKDALVMLERDTKPNDVHTLLTMEQNIPHADRAECGWIYAPVGRGTWGGAIVMDRHIAECLIDHANFKRYLNTDAEGRLIDAVPYETLAMMKVAVRHHLPSLADHIGQGHSTLGNEHEGTSTRGFRFNEWSTRS